MAAPSFAAFSWKVQLTYDHTKVGGGTENESSFPALISISDSSIKTTANGGKVSSSTGADLLAFSDSGCSTQLPSELEFYDGTGGAAILWVEVSTLSYTSNGSIYVCTGNASPPARMPNPWDANFSGVWHLPNGSTLTANDSTTNANDGTVTGATAGAGKIDGAGSFNGTSNYIAFTNTISPSSVSFGAWLYWEDSTGHAFPLFLGNSSGYGFFISGGADNCGYGNVIDVLVPGSTCDAANSSYVLPTNAWTYVVATFNGSTWALYANGSLQSSQGGGHGNPDIPGGIDYYGLGSGSFHGLVDEARVSSVARSAGWISTEYQNQNAPGNIGSAGFWTFGSWAPVAPGSRGFQIVMEER